MSFEERTYRSTFNEDRFSYFKVVHLETDLWIGVGHDNDLAENGQRTDDEINELRSYIKQYITALRSEIETFILKHPEFNTSFTPLTYKGKVPGSIQQLLEASAIAGTGPMAGIAGLFSEHIVKRIRKDTSNAEILAENGGDIFISTTSELLISIYAGDSPLSKKLALKIPKGEWGICTSSGTVGHSTSFGKADAVTVVSKSTVLADALATHIANQVHTPDDIQEVLEDSNKYKGIEGVVIICEDKIGITGNIELVPVL